MERDSNFDPMASYAEMMRKEMNKVGQEAVKTDQPKTEQISDIPESPVTVVMSGKQAAKTKEFDLTEEFEVIKNNLKIVLDNYNTHSADKLKEAYDFLNEKDINTNRYVKSSKPRNSEEYKIERGERKKELKLALSDTDDMKVSIESDGRLKIIGFNVEKFGVEVDRVKTGKREEETPTPPPGVGAELGKQKVKLQDVESNKKQETKVNNNGPETPPSASASVESVVEQKNVDKSELEQKEINYPKNEHEVKSMFIPMIFRLLNDFDDENAIKMQVIKAGIEKTFAMNSGLYSSLTVDKMISNAVEGDDRKKALLETELNSLIEATMNLRRAQLREKTYRRMENSAALKEMIKDNKEGGKESVFITRETMIALGNLPTIEGELSSEGVEKAFAVMIAMGEKKNNLNSEDWMQKFACFRPEKIKKDKTRVFASTNFYDNKYFNIKLESGEQIDPQQQKELELKVGKSFNDISQMEVKTKFWEEMNDTFGEYSVTLAKQLFDAYKEEGNYYWNHYMSKLFTYGSGRQALATLPVGYVYSGSGRAYKAKVDLNSENVRNGITEEIDKLKQEGRQDLVDVIEKELKTRIPEKKLSLRGVIDLEQNHVINKETKRVLTNGIKKELESNEIEYGVIYEKQLSRLAVSPLNVKKMENKDQTLFDNEVVEEPRFLLRSALSGKLLSGVHWEDTADLMSTLPQTDSFSTIKKGDDLKEAIGALGELAKKEDKSKLVGEAVNQLSILRDKGSDLVSLGVIKQEDLDHQLEIETANVVHDMSVENESNLLNIQLQSALSPNFMNVGAINDLYQRLMGMTLDGRSLLLDVSKPKISMFIKMIRDKTYLKMINPSIFSDGMDESSEKVIEKTKAAAKKRIPLDGSRLETKEQEALRNTNIMIGKLFGRLKD